MRNRFAWSWLKNIYFGLQRYTLSSVVEELLASDPLTIAIDCTDSPFTRALFFRPVALMKHPYIFTIEQRTNLICELSIIYKTPPCYIPKHHQRPQYAIKRYQHPKRLRAFEGCWERCFRGTWEVLGSLGMFLGALVVCVDR